MDLGVILLLREPQTKGFCCSMYPRSKERERESRKGEGGIGVENE